ncbi:MAG TPA: DUF6600 domain-containing protein [Polyangia bacterium]
MLVALGLVFFGTSAFAQQPLRPAPAPPVAPPQYDPRAAAPQAMPPQQADPYAQYGEPDEEDDGMDVTYDISTSPEADPQEQQYDDGYDPYAYQQFESQLAPYGTWEDVPDYGHVWIPSENEVGDDFQPYDTNGNFVDSDYGWAWSSNYSWGWAPFHYGRWAYSGGYGWCWIPGTMWGPAWVNWRWGGGYAGWAPMGPRGTVVGPPRGVRSPWRFTVAGQLGALHPHYLPSRAVASVWKSTTAVHNDATMNVRGAQVRINTGPSATMFAAATGRALTPARLAAVAPHALPRATIAPHAGTALAQRPWMASRQTLGGAFARTVPGSHTLGSGPIASRPGTATIGYRTPQPVNWGGGNVYRASQPQPMYRTPYAQPYRGGGGTLTVYHAPAQYHYAAPAPMQSYHAAPAYHYAAPMQTYHAAPEFHYAAPATQSYAAPAVHSSAPAAFHGGGGGGFHGGGGHR